MHSNGMHTPLMHTQSPPRHNRYTPSASLLSHDRDDNEHNYYDLYPRPKDNISTRQKRYLLAERRLTETFARCASEATTQELQLRALERANELLKALAYDSSFRAKKLREKTAVMEAREAEYRAGRLTQGVDEVKRVLSQVQRGEPDTEDTLRQNRKDANLARFLASSQRRTCRRRTVAYRPPKRMSKTDVKPFRLAPFPSTQSLTRLHPSTLSHSSTTSATATTTATFTFTDHQSPTPTPTDQYLPTLADSSGPTMKRSLVPPPIDVSRPLTTVVEDYELGSPTSSSEGCSSLATPTISAAAFPSLPVHPSEGSSVGSVTIYQPRVRTRSQIWKDVRPQMPDYATDLLRNLNDMTRTSSDELKLYTFEVRSRWSESNARSSIQTDSAYDHTRPSDLEYQPQDMQESPRPEQEEDSEDGVLPPLANVSLDISIEPESPTTSAIPRPSLDPAWSMISIPATIPPQQPASPRRLSRFLDGSERWHLSFVLPTPRRFQSSSSSKALDAASSSATRAPRKRMLSAAGLRHRLAIVTERPEHSATDDKSSLPSSTPDSKENLDFPSLGRRSKNRFSFIRPSS